MKTAIIQRWLWRIFLLWTLAIFYVLPFDVGEAQIKLWITQPDFQSLFLRILKVLDAGWIVLAAANIYFYLIQQEGLNAARRSGAILLFGISLVLGIGVNTGQPFGPFVYTSQLGAKIFGVPFSVPLLWLVIITAARYSVLNFFEHARRWQIAVVTGLLVTAVDVSLEWIAWRIRGYWLWYFPLAKTPDWPPLQNYLAWFLLTTLLTWVAFPAARPVGKHWRPVIMLVLINLLFWLTIALRLGR